VVPLKVARCSPVSWQTTRLVRLRVRCVNELSFRHLHRN
jgi:hypothetical protein